MAALGFGYFLAYIPFAALTKALSSGLIPGVDEEVGGLVLLPAAAIGVIVGATVFLLASGWWRDIGVREVRGRPRRVPGRAMLIAGFFMALIIGTTILNFTFAGVSILFMLLMMRAGTLTLAPIVDAARRRPVRAYSWGALVLSLIAIAIALSGVDSYALTLGAIVSLGLYFSGYIGRFEIMSRVAKAGESKVSQRYLAAEGISAAVWLLALCGLLALVLPGGVGSGLREGFTGFMLSAEALIAVGVGLLYATLYVFGTLIYLDPREYSWCVPVNRGASVFSVLIASYLLTWLWDVPAPHSSALVAAVFVLAAIVVLSWPAIRKLLQGTVPPKRELLLFVCSGNRGRSPIAAALARAELVRAKPGRFSPWIVASAGVKVSSPGAPVHEVTYAAARDLGLSLDLHAAEPLTRELCESAAYIYCMTGEQRAAVLAIAPSVAERTFCIDPDQPFPEPSLKSSDAWRAAAERLRDLVHRRLSELPASRLVPQET